MSANIRFVLLFLIPILNSWPLDAFSGIGESMIKISFWRTVKI